MPQNVEPYIHYDFGEHVTKKKAAALCVATTACFYVCKVKTSNVKITHRFPWICLQSMELDNDRTVVSFTFSTGSVEYMFENCIEFVTKVGKYVRMLLPSYHSAVFTFPPVVEVPEVKQSRTAIADLFLSQSILDKSPDYDFALALRRSMKLQRTVKVEKTRILDSTVQALMSALVYAPSVQSVAVYGKGIVDVWGKLVRVISFNHGIRSLTLNNCKKSKGLNEFFDCLSWASVEELYLQNMEIDEAMARYMAEKMRMTSLSSIGFDKCVAKKCSFVRTILPMFLENHDCLENIRSVRIVRDHVRADDMHNLMLMLTRFPIEKLALINSHVDLQLFFEHLAANTDSVEISELDLSENVCTKDFTGQYLLPGSLTVLKLKKVKWEGRSLLKFMDMHDFMSMLEIDLSQAIVSDSQVNQFLAGLSDEPPCQSVRGIRWCFNPLSVKLMDFFSNLKYLKILSISQCSFPESNTEQRIVPSLINLLSKTNLQSLSISGTLSGLKDKWIVQMQEVLSHHPSIKHLNISGNAIGDNGIAVLRDILQINSRISNLNFDDQDLSSPDVLISFMQFLAELDSVRSVVEPKNEMRRLTDKTNKHRGREMKRVWKELSERKKLQEDEVDTATDLSTASIAPSESSPGFLERSNPELTWDLDISPPCDDTMKGWVPLKNKYSYANLTRTATEEPIPSGNPGDELEFE